MPTSVSVHDVAITTEDLEEGRESIPSSHAHLDAHAFTWETRGQYQGVILGCENPAEYVSVFLPLREITVVQVSGRSGPFVHPTYKVYAPTKLKRWAYARFDYNRHHGTKIDDGRPGGPRYYYGGGSVGLWRGFREYREESGSFVRVREAELERLRAEEGFGCITFMGIGGITRLWDAEREGRWILEFDDVRWASADWTPGEDLPPGVEMSLRASKKDLVETMMGRHLSDDEYAALGD